MALLKQLVPVIALICTIATTTVSAQAACTVTGVQTMSGALANLGRYSATSAPVAQTMRINLVLTVSSTGGTCSGTVAANSPTVPAQMSGAGADKLRYDVQTLGGNSILYAATPGTRVAFSATAANGATTVTASVNIQAVAVASQTVQAGGYSDAGVVLAVFDTATPSVQVPGAASWFVNAAVNPTCTIGGLFAAADPATVNVPVTAAGTVSTAQIQRSYGSVLCNAPTDITMSSQNGGIRNPTAPSSGFVNVIHYAAQASFGAATATLNTATSAMTTGSISNTTGAAGTMQVTIVPQQPASLPIAGRYDDVLTITLAPQ